MTLRRRLTLAVAATFVLGILTACGLGNTGRTSGSPATSKPASSSKDGRDRRNLAYVESGDPVHALDLFLPEKSDGPAPVFVWVHGGGWRGGDKADVDEHLLKVGRLRDDLLNAGIAVASVNYHLLPQTRFPQPMQDVSAAVRYLKAESSNLGLDPERVAIGGESAGAHLAGMVAMTPKEDALHGTIGPKTDPSVKAFLGYYGIYEFTTRLAQQRGQGCNPGRTGVESSHGRLIGADPESPEGRMAAEKASPISHVRKTSPPSLLIHGKQDCTAPAKQSVDLGEKLKQSGVEQQVVLIDAGHAQPVFYTDDNLRSQAVQFLVGKLKG
ncbi:alpha/beta hydrolase [Austwickia chelonae]|uniref:alpha/beta hydrolase n=1 Tax=Austwickia chelonae TaxID=100225 RepID=UPI000E25BC2F|nr:alpha/beta hydrolase [Austwickia chelonae]